MAVAVSALNPRSVKALAVFAQCATWQTGRRKADGRSFFLIPGSAGVGYYVDAHECTCPDFVRRNTECKHQLAVRLWLAAFQTGQVRPRGRTTSAADDLIVLTPMGAAALVEARGEDDAADEPAEHPQVTQLRAMLAGETCPEEREAIAAKLDDTRAKIAAVAERRRGIALLPRHLGDED